MHSVLDETKSHFCRQFIGAGMTNLTGHRRQLGCTTNNSETWHTETPSLRVVR